MERTAKLVTFGNGGHTIELGKRSYASGYLTPDNPPRSDDSYTIPNGCPVIDERPAIATPEGYAWVFKGPMVDVDLPDGECEPLQEPDAMFARAVCDNAYGTLLAVHAVTRVKNKRGSLDYVSTREYIDGWRAVGARIGHYENSAIIWED